MPMLNVLNVEHSRHLKPLRITAPCNTPQLSLVGAVLTGAWVHAQDHTLTTSSSIAAVKRTHLRSSAFHVAQHELRVRLLLIPERLLLLLLQRWLWPPLLLRR
jgi:hypothetical protein